MREIEETEGMREEVEAVEVVEGGEGAEEEEEREGEIGVVSRWEKFLPRMPVRVLLVEGDDSTRQIIAALLRKCSYRVSVASDGLKAWDTLKEKPQSIDLVLTEVDLPSISGFGLLTMIMDHDPCKNIPVIMMSSHDSMSMVFKCMLKGAADFLIKPIRKNELRNLWQHVWRRQIVNGDDGMHEIQDKSDVNKKLKSQSGATEHSVEYEATLQANKESSEQGSDAQSSCTRSDVEAESAHKKLELKLQVADALKNQNEETVKMEKASSHEIAVKAVSKTVDVRQKGCLDRNTINNETCGQKRGRDITYKDADVVQLIDNKPLSLFPSRYLAVHDHDVTHKSPAPNLELSLKRYEGTLLEKQECDESNAWNHSSSSAFSLYSRVPMLRQKNSGYESNGVPMTSLKDQSSSVNMEDMTKSPPMALSDQDGKAIQCTPVRVIPFPLPVGSVSLNSGYGTVMQQMFYPQSGHPFWNNNASVWPDAIKQANSSHQPGQENLNSVQSDIPDELNARSSSHYSAGKQDEHMELDEQKHVSSAAGESGGSSICNGSRNHLNSSECGSVLSGTAGHTFTTNAFRPMTVSGNDEANLVCEGMKPADCHRLTQREMALNKFRLKRKERCFEKKVRYQSRKLLAEQRPRVKGQFVRQEKPNTRPRLAGAVQGDSVAG
ncbi:two-component response regulator-like PRR95 isoform X1 [Canna indica]|uniref:Two-component response regulator-like PRR95 isoform X1 n=1 Tax=Canna indica TaxID=4628 RepID=A0AAQ3PYG7_9LILI|nr:two-component response regulator-like PRR95 isoform X1 [Canna indica]